MTNLNSAMPLREQNVWASLITTVIIWGGYFSTTILTWRERSLGQVALLLLAAVVLHGVVLAAVQIVLAANTRAEAKDERDLLIELRSCRVAYYVLLSGVMLTVTGLLLLSPIPTEAGLAHPLLVAHAIIISAVLAEIAKEGTQVLLYRVSA